VLIYLQLVLTAIFWGAVFHLGKYAIGYMSPLSVAAWRFLLAAVMLLPIVFWRTRPDFSAARRNALPLLAMGIIGVFGFNASLFYGLQQTSPVNASLIMATNPAITALLAAWLSGDKISLRQRWGFVISLVGVIVIVAQGSMHHLMTLTFSTGDMFIFLGNLCWASYTVIPKRFINNVQPMLITVTTITTGALALAICAQSVSGDLFVVNSWHLVVAVFCMAFFGSVLAYIWWNQGIARLGARVAVFLNLVPMFTMLMGIALGQMPTAPQLVGALLVITGVMVAVYNR
jgi:drug/metabolite transporter (DMT)-like permease